MTLELPRTPLTCALAIVTALTLATASTAQEIDPLATVVEAQSLCAQDAETTACNLATRRAVAIVANAVAEAGNSKDRGTFLAPVRILLTDKNPEIRTSAAYALAKLGPDADDTPLLISLLRDPISNVRAGAWSAARNSSDPTAKLIARRIPEHPASTGYTPDPKPFDPAALGFAVPEAAGYLWITADLREQTPGARLDFLISGPSKQTLTSFAALTPGGAQPVLDFMISDPVVGPAVGGFLDTELYDDPRVVSLPPTDTLPQRLIVVYHDRIFGQTGFAVIFADDRTLVPAVEAPADIVLAPDGPLDPAAFDAALLRASGFKPEADPDESDFFMAIVAAGSFGAETYLQIYPDGAYATEAKAMVSGPRLILDGTAYTDTSDVTVSFKNLPPGSSATIQVMNVAADYLTVATQYLPDATTEQALFAGVGLVPGIYLVVAEIAPDDGSTSFSLNRDFSVVPGEVTLTTEKAEYAPGEAITVTFSGMSGDTYDYVATTEAGAPNFRTLQYKYTNGALDGTTTLSAPTAPGAYELRAFFRDDDTLLRASLAFTVTGAAQPPAPEAPAATAPAAAPAAPGEPSAEAQATLALNKPSYAPGEDIVITFSGMSGDLADYLGTAEVGSPNFRNWNTKYTDGAREGSLTLSAPTAPGSYEVRAFFKDDESVLRGSVPFKVE